jgi:release factor glutamine methyltransferase
MINLANLSLCDLLRQSPLTNDLVYRWGWAHLHAKNIDQSALDARILWMHTTNQTLENFTLNKRKPASPDHAKTYHQFIQRRLQHEPVSRITGHKEFWGLDFQINEHTLDPRPDSELIIEHVSQHIQNNPARVLDLGTGSGCLLISLLHTCPQATGVGIDINQKALDMADKNAYTNSIDKYRATWVCNKWLDNLTIQPFDWVMCNPPYISAADYTTLMPDVKLYDPHKALVADDNGLADYKHIIRQLPAALVKGGWIIFEHGFDQAASLSALLKAADFGYIQTLKDLAGHDRCTIAQYKD